MTVTIYGIRNCDTMKKARNWLEANGIAAEFHDYKTAGIDRACVLRWIEAAGWEKVLNRSGTTFRKLDEADKADLNADKAVDLMIAQPSMIKRPVLEYPGGVIVGFAPDNYARALL